MAPQQIRPIRVEGNVAYVPLTRGYEAIIDAEDVPLVSGHNWYAKVTPHTVYAVRRPSSGAIYLHRVILPLADGLLADHKNGDGLDNRRANLREATPGQNQYNKGGSRNSVSGVKGVSPCRKTGLWRARIKVDGKELALGSFHTVGEARAAYLSAASALHGEYAATR